MGRGDVPYLLGGFFLADIAFSGNGITDLVRNSDPGRTSTKYHGAKVAQLLLADVQGGHDGGERDASGALHVIIEARNLGAVHFQEAPSCFV